MTCIRPEMVFWVLTGVLHRFGGCGVLKYASPQTFVRPWSEPKILISESDTEGAQVGERGRKFIGFVKCPIC